jgi:hypothetical protein
MSDHLGFARRRIGGKRHHRARVALERENARLMARGNVMDP